MARLLVIMGSGETAPTMIKLHRSILARCGTGPAVVLDTPYGFQENADDISARAIGYFDASVGHAVDVASWRRTDQPAAAQERTLAVLRAASWIFAGPGSPTYALRQWQDTPIPQILANCLRDGGAVVFASAAALTLGSHTIPVYEIYKAGEDPDWRPGLDLVRTATGLPAVVIPHYDNAEGGHHDTRFCYLGERRLARLESRLPADAFIIGVDEHTAVVLDLDAETATVSGNGVVTIRRHGASAAYPDGSVITFSELASGRADAASPAATAAVQGGEGSVAPHVSPVRADADRMFAAFTGAGSAGDADARVNAILDLEYVLREWAADLSDDAEHARSVLRTMIVALSDHANGSAPVSETIAPLMEALIELRNRARAAKDFATSDWIRDTAAGAGVEIRDEPAGATWHMR